MNREQIEKQVLRTFNELFEVENPEMDVNLREAYEFDSIDAIELLGEIEKMLDCELTRAEKKQAMEIRTIRQICDYVEGLAAKR